MHIDRNKSLILKGFYEHYNRRKTSSKSSEANLTLYTVWRHEARTINKKQDTEHQGTWLLKLVEHIEMLTHHYILKLQINSLNAKLTEYNYVCPEDEINYVK